MEYRRLGRSGLKVSALSMGTYSFGFAHEIEDAQRLVEVCLDHGINVFDTANMYASGRSEEILGQALASRRQDVHICSKVRMKVGTGPNDEGLSRHHIIRECEASLKRLKTDYLDIYLMHEWDGQTPVEETLSALDTLTRQGKIRYVGCSNYAGWHVMKMLASAAMHGYPQFVTQQIHYSLASREAEYELLPLSVDNGLGIMVWSPLAGGLLSGDFDRNNQPKSLDPREGWTGPMIQDHGKLWNIVDLLRDLAKKYEATPAQISLAWTLQRPNVSSAVIGGLTAQHFEANIAAAEIRLGDEDLAVLDSTSAAPYIYPYWHQGFFASDRLSAADQVLHRQYR